MNAEALALSGIQGRRVLRLYHLYRLTIGVVLVLLISSDMDTQLLKLAHAELFRYGSWFYLILNILVAVVVQRPKHLAQIFSLALVDVILLSALFYAAGGTPSGIGNLLIVAVAIANILLRGRIGLLIAAVAAMGLIYLTFYLSLSRPEASAQYVQAGALGALCFAAALLLQGLELSPQAHIEPHHGQPTDQQRQRQTAAHGPQLRMVAVVLRLRDMQHGLALRQRQAVDTPQRRIAEPRCAARGQRLGGRTVGAQRHLAITSDQLPDQALFVRRGRFTALG